MTAERRTETEAEKAKLLIENVIFKYSPDYKDEHIREWIREDYQRINVAREMEKVMSFCSKGQYVHTDGYGSDHSDDSDTKCVAIGANKMQGCNSTQALIYNVGSKKGALRIVVSDVHNHKVRYFFLPSKVWPSFTNKTNTIYFCMHMPTESIKRFKNYEFSSFEELAQMSDEKFYMV